MVASSLLDDGRARALGLAALVALGGCGESLKQPFLVGGRAGQAGASTAAGSGGGGTGAAGNGGTAATGARIEPGLGGAEAGGLGGAPDLAAELVGLDGPPCETRRAGDCTGIVEEYSSNGSAFDGTPELAECREYVSFDGCGQLVFAFDATGCAVSVGPGRNGWKYADHLSYLQKCLADAFADARFSCQASKTLTFTESCGLR